jgi:hypothetical protein
MGATRLFFKLCACFLPAGKNRYKYSATGGRMGLFTAGKKV